MDTNVEKTKYAFFGEDYKDPLSLYVYGQPKDEDRHISVLGITLQPHRGFATHVNKKAVDARLLQLAAVSFFSSGPRTNTLRALYLALVRDKIVYGIAVCCEDTSHTNQEDLGFAQKRAC